MDQQGKHGAGGRRGAIILLALIAGLLLIGIANGGFSFAGVRAVSPAGTVSAQASAGEIATGAGIFTEATIALMVSILFIGAFSLQIARNYFLRTLDKFTLRLGADIWWLAYIMIRDGLMFGSLLLGFEMFFVGTYGDYAMAVPFMPLAIVLVAAALVVKLVRDPDEEEKWNRVVSVLIAGATFLYIFGSVMVTESIAGYAAAGYVTDPTTGMITTPTGGSDVWTILYNAFSSTVNPGLATISFYACFAVLGAFATFAFIYVTKPNLRPFRKAPEKLKATTPTTRDKAVQPVTQKTP